MAKSSKVFYRSMAPWAVSHLAQQAMLPLSLPNKTSVARLTLIEAAMEGSWIALAFWLERVHS